MLLETQRCKIHPLVKDEPYLYGYFLGFSMDANCDRCDDRNFPNAVVLIDGELFFRNIYADRVKLLTE